MQTKIAKQIIFGILSVCASFFLWQFFAGITLHGGYAHIFPWVYFAIALAASAGFLFLVSLGRNAWVVWLVSTVNAALLFVFFIPVVATVVAAICIAIAGGVIAGFPGSVARSTTGVYHASAYRLAWPLSLALLGFAAYVSSSLFTPTRLANTISQYGYPYISASIAPFNSDQTVDSYIVSQLQAPGAPKPTSAEIFQALEQLHQQTGITLKGDEKLSDVGKQFITLRAESVLQSVGFGQQKWYFLFIMLLILAPFLRLIMALGADLFVTVGKATGLVHTAEEQVTVKTFTL